LEARVANLDEQLSIEGNERQNAVRNLRKLEKRYGDLNIVIDDERRLVETYKTDVDRSNTKNKLMKRQIDEMEEEMTRLSAKTRRFQREIEDLTEANETLTNELKSLRSRKNVTRTEVRTTRTIIGGQRIGSDYNQHGSTDHLNMTDGSAGSREGSLADEVFPGGAPTNGEHDRKSLDGMI